MITNINRYKADLEKLIVLGTSMILDLNARSVGDDAEPDGKAKELAKAEIGSFEREYQKWYTEAYSVIRQLIPDRLLEFEQLYKGDGKHREINASTYHIQYWLNGIMPSINPLTSAKYFDGLSIVCMRLQTQVRILMAVESRFESSLFDIKQLVQVDLFDSELETCVELLRHGFVRAAGAVAGVVLEKHLAQVAENHNAVSRKKHPSIGDFNDLLKNRGVVDVPTWRGIQRLADLRNLCDHNKEREPTPEEISELIAGVEKITKTLF